MLLAGPSGVGKSDLALRLILDCGAKLVSDDQTTISLEGDTLVASSPETIAGLIEVRHVGLLKQPYCTAAPIGLYVELVESDKELERIPTGAGHLLLGRSVRKFVFCGRHASTPSKIRMALLGSFQDE